MPLFLSVPCDEVQEFFIQFLIMRSDDFHRAG
jgi:hypothetical protein